MTDLLICPHCGHTIEIQRDKRLSSLPQNTVQMWDRIHRYLMRGDRLGTSRAGEIAHMSPQAAQRHLRRLASVGLVQPVPKREGGVYYVYALKK